MIIKAFTIWFTITPVLVAPAETAEKAASINVDLIRRDNVIPNGDVDLVDEMGLLQRRRRSGSSSVGWDPSAPWGMGMDGREYGHSFETGWGMGGGGSGDVGSRPSGEFGPGGARVDVRLTPGVGEGGSDGRSGLKGGGGGGRSKGGSPKGSVKDIIYPEEAEGGGRSRQSNRQKSNPYQRWLQSQLLNQQLRPPPQGPEQGLHPVASQQRPLPPPPDYQQLKSRQFRPRLLKLDTYFTRLGVMSEDCRQRLLCEVSREPARFFPLSNVLEEEAGFTGNYQYLTSQLVNSTEGARLLSYMEANLRGQDRARTCDIYQRRCLSRAEDMINFHSLIVWREMIRWLTIHVLTRVP